MSSSSDKKRQVDDDNDDFEEEEEEVKVTKKVKTDPAPKKKGETVFELGGKKKVSVGHFKGTILVNIREYYSDKTTGEEKPGSKGIALNAHQFIQLQSQMNAICDAIEALESV